MYALTLFVILAGFLIETGLSALNYRYRNHPIPENVSDVYKQDEYLKWKSYAMEVTRLSIFSDAAERIVTLLFLILGFFPALFSLAQGFSANPIPQTLTFLAGYGAVRYILGLGFRLYRIFNIEERYGFNTTTLKTFALDQAKSLVLFLALGGPLAYLSLHLFLQMGRNSLLAIWLIVIGVLLSFNILYTRLFIGLFNKLTPLKEGELYDKSKSLAKKTGYGIQKISVMDASKRSTKLNAFFTGFGRFKHIILYDTLLDKCDTDEIISILAHEIGHSKHKDVLKGLVFTAVQFAVLLVILSFFLTSDAFAQAFGFERAHLGFGVVLFNILLEPVSLLAGIPASAYSRRAEYKADAFAAKAADKSAMIRALKILARENFANLTPHPAVVLMTYSHPPVSDRIRVLESLSAPKKRTDCQPIL